MTDIIFDIVPFLDTSTTLSLALVCKHNYELVQSAWIDVVISDEFLIEDETKMSQLITLTKNMESLVIDFPIDPNENKQRHDVIAKLKRKYTEELSDLDIPDEKGHELALLQSNKRKIDKPISFPNYSLNPSYTPQLKKLWKIDFKTCPNNSQSSFINSFLLHFMKYLNVVYLGIPRHVMVRHSSVRILDLNELQIGFDGMNVHIGADLIGITHIKSQLPKLEILICNELFLFIGDDIYINCEKSGPQYWGVMRKRAHDSGIKVLFRENNIAIMLMPDAHGKKEAPKLEYREWNEIEEWITQRVGDFIAPLQYEFA